MESRLRHKVLVVFTVYVPENSGLQRFNYLARQYVPWARLQPVRGEKIPELVEQYGGYGWTGNDLYQDYLSERQKSSLKVINFLPWPESIKPTLCLLGPSEENFPSESELCAYNNGIRVAVPDKYVNLATNYFNRKCWNSIFIIREGQVDRQIRSGQADLAVDIVYSGKTIREENLLIRKVIFEESGLVLLTKDI